MTNLNEMTIYEALLWQTMDYAIVVSGGNVTAIVKDIPGQEEETDAEHTSKYRIS